MDANPTSENLDDPESLTRMTAEVVASYVANNAIDLDELTQLIQSVSQTLHRLGQTGTDPAPAPARLSAAEIRKSITPHGLISFLDGRPYKTLKRHLSTHGLTIAQYKATFGLPDDYPTTAPTYSKRRSELALSIGLGKRGRPEVPGKPAAEPKQKSLRKRTSAASATQPG